MATWEELSRENLQAAKLLVGHGCLRSSISRSYYAAYCAIAGTAAARGVSFPHGWKNPSHEQMPELIAHNLPLPPVTRRQMNRNIRFLRDAREGADYRPGAVISRAVTLECLHRSRWIMKALGIDDD